MQCLAPTYLGEYHLKGADLRRSGINRIGNMVVPNNNYCLFEDWIMPILDAMLKEQLQQGILWTPSKVAISHMRLPACPPDPTNAFAMSSNAAPACELQQCLPRSTCNARRAKNCSYLSAQCNLHALAEGLTLPDHCILHLCR